MFLAYLPLIVELRMSSSLQSITGEQMYSVAQSYILRTWLFLYALA